MDKICNVVMLPSNEKANINKKDIVLYKELSILHDDDIDKPVGSLLISKRTVPNSKNWEKQNLYITSNEQIRDGDWFYADNIHGKIEKAEYDNHGILINGFIAKACKKVIATTDSSLKTKVQHDSDGFLNIPLPQPSQSFIQKYVDEYNKGNIITDVLVEYDDKMGYCNKCNAYQYSSYIGCNYNGICDGKVIPDTKLKVSKDNTITIRRVKDSWSRDEVADKIRQYQHSVDRNEVTTIAQWIKENL